MELKRVVNILRYPHQIKLVEVFSLADAAFSSVSDSRIAVFNRVLRLSLFKNRLLLRLQRNPYRIPRIGGNSLPAV